MDVIERQSIARARVRAHATRRTNPCPLCGRTTGNGCIVYPDEQRPRVTHVWCIEPADRTNGILLPDWGFRKDREGLWYFALDTDTLAPRTAAPVRRDAIRPLADATTIDRVLRATARILDLSDAHRVRLAARGYDPASVGPEGRHAFASLPPDVEVRKGLTLHLLARVATSAEDLTRTYGFVEDRRYNGSPILFLPRVAALIEFIRDADGNFVGFEYAPDEPGDGPKRLSPSRLPKASLCHAARPEADDGTEVWHTEAVHKANLTAEARRAVALGSLGAGNAGVLLAAARAVDPKARRRHVVALDTDQWGGRAERDLARKLHDAGFRVALARWDGARAKGPDDAVHAGLEIATVDYEDDRPRQRRDRRVAVAHPWQRATRVAVEHAATLDAAGERMVDGVRAYLRTDSGEHVHVVAAPPGLGKTRLVSRIGAKSSMQPLGEVDIAWVAERLNMRAEADAFRFYQHIDAPNTRNCPHWKIHRQLAEAGYSTAPFHRQHGCAYYAQWQQQGSAIYQLARVGTPHIERHQASVVDEFDLSRWLPDYRATLHRLRRAAQQWRAGQPAHEFLVRLQAVLADAKADHAATARDGRDYVWPSGKALFDALDKRSGGRLAALIGQMAQDGRATDLFPFPHGLDQGGTPDELAAAAAALPPVILPHVWHAFADELADWQRGGVWNSCLRLGVDGNGEPTLFITERRAFGRKAASRPLVVLDATPPSEEVLRLIFGRPVVVERPEVMPPASMRHIAIRTGARYGKTVLTQEPSRARNLRTVARRCLHELSRLDPDGALRAAGLVGLVTYKDIERELAEALGINYVPPAEGDERDQRGRTLHFGACRGSNKLAGCTILLVVGTYTLPPDEVLRLARAIYRKDPMPLDEATTRDARGHWTGYRDPRVQALSEYLTWAELTQAAHRNRPLRHEGRTVVTFCAGAVGYLPVTTKVEELPQLTDEGLDRREVGERERAARLEWAWAALEERGEKPTVRALYAMTRARDGTGIRLNSIVAWLRARRDAVATAANVMTTTGVLSDRVNSSITRADNTAQIAATPPHLVPASAAPQQCLMPVGAAAAAARAPARWPSFPERVAELERRGHTRDEAIRHTLLERGAVLEGA